MSDGAAAPPARLVRGASSRGRRFELGRIAQLRIIVIGTLALGINYIAWRWTHSLNWDAAWISVALVSAETYSMIDVCLFGMMMWKAKTRPLPPPAPVGLSVDIFIATYNESVEMVMATATAARDVRYPHTTWILDDGARPEMASAAAAIGVEYISRGPDWENKPRHAKAGNVNNALMQTNGDFMLILDADQIPRPEILDETLGYFIDDRVALCQTPQVFTNVSPGDPLGSQAPLFYGPIQQGKDGWNAAFFCGSNAILRREALMQLGVVKYVEEVETTLGAAVKSALRSIRVATLTEEIRDPLVRAALLDAKSALLALRRDQRSKAGPLADIVYQMHEKVDAAHIALVAEDIAAISADVDELILSADRRWTELNSFSRGAALTALATRELAPLRAVPAVLAALRRVEIDRPHEAQPVMPIATISVTEDMATSMRLHGLGWRSVYHNRLLADGLAPEDLGTMLTQRLRWGQGTMQVFLRENPLLQWKMSMAQRLMYFATMWSYISGFAAVIYFAAPIIFLALGILPVATDAFDFFVRFLPFIACNQLLFFVAARGIPTWRGQQYSLALFPVWIRACTSAFENVVLKIPLGFAVTKKTKREESGAQWGLLKPQLAVIATLVLAMVIGCLRLYISGADPIGTLVNLFWAGYDLVVLSVLYGAARYRGHQPAEPTSNNAGTQP